MTLLDKIQTEIEAGNVMVKKHPEVDYYIYNYTPDCQFKRRWNGTNMMCRGLILNEYGEIIARPFPKFFNYEELPGLGIQIPNETFEVYDKLDGSLGILYKMPDGTPRIATRGSFDSEQARVANRILENRYKDFHFKDGFTYLFEIIYPDNRIVVNYGDVTDLFLLAIIDNETGFDFSINDISLPTVKKYDGVKDFRVLTKNDKNNSEGFVVKFDNGFRLKMKFEEYVRLHRIVTGLNEKAVWEMLKDGADFDSILVNLPEEFEKWIKEVKDNFEKEFDTNKALALGVFERVKNLSTRKEQAITIKNSISNKLWAVVFKMLDGKGYDEYIWKILKPITKEDDDG